MVTTTVGCEGLEGADKEHYLGADTPRDFANSVAYLLNNERVRKQLGMNARKLAIEKYDWQIIINKMDAWYRRLKNNGQQP